MPKKGPTWLASNNMLNKACLGTYKSVMVQCEEAFNATRKREWDIRHAIIAPCVLA